MYAVIAIIPKLLILKTWARRSPSRQQVPDLHAAALQVPCGLRAGGMSHRASSRPGGKQHSWPFSVTARHILSIRTGSHGPNSRSWCTPTAAGWIPTGRSSRRITAWHHARCALAVPTAYCSTKRAQAGKAHLYILAGLRSHQLRCCRLPEASRCDGCPSCTGRSPTQY